jgi:hypothetical protein
VSGGLIPKGILFAHTRHKQILSLACHPLQVDAVNFSVFQLEVVQPPVRDTAAVERDNATLAICHGESPCCSVAATLSGSLLPHVRYLVSCQLAAAFPGGPGTFRVLHVANAAG